MRFLRTPGFLATSALLVLLVLSFTGILPADRFAGFVSRTIIAPFYAITSRPHTAIEKENNDLRRALANLLGNQLEETIIKEQKDNQAAMRMFTETRGFQEPLFARVLTRIDRGGKQYFLLNRGKRDGIAPYETVFSGKGILVGRIVEVQQTTSLFQLLTAGGQRFSVMAEGEKTLLGTTEGSEDRDVLQTLFVPREITIPQQKLLVTSGLDEGVPYGLLVGIVATTKPIENSPWQEVNLFPVTRPSGLFDVGILRFSPQE